MKTARPATTMTNSDGNAASDDVMKMADLYESIKEMECPGMPSIWDRDRY
jgi:hypothetical protein